MNKRRRFKAKRRRKITADFVSHYIQMYHELPCQNVINYHHEVIRQGNK